MLRLVVPRGNRFFSGVLILCADGEVEGPRGEELRKGTDGGFRRTGRGLLEEEGVGPHLALSSVLSSMGGSVLLEGWPDDDMDLVWRGRVALMAVDGVLPDTSVKLNTEGFHRVGIVYFHGLLHW